MVATFAPGSNSINESTVFHIIHVINISKSRLNQLDEWLEYDNPNNASVDRLKKKVVREVNIEDEANTDKSDKSSDKSTYKLLIRDAQNNYAFAYEYQYLPFLHGNTGTPLGIQLGGRLLVKAGAQVVDGVILLTDGTCEYLGVDQGDMKLFEDLNTGIVEKYKEMLTSEDI